MGHSHIDWDTWDLIDAVNRRQPQTVVHKTEYVYIDNTPREPPRYTGGWRKGELIKASDGTPRRNGRFWNPNKPEPNPRKKFQQYLFEEFGWYSSLAE
jgi:hypothetical protein